MRPLLACLALLAWGCKQPSDPAFVVTPVDHPRGAEVTGGTLLLAEAGKLAVVSEADADRVVLVSLEGTPWGRAVISLPPRSHPGRMALDDARDLYVVLRAAGKVAKISLARDELISTRDVCADPRGITWDPGAHVMRIACASGVLAELPVDGAATAIRLVPDLRDVLLTPRGIRFTTFRSAKVLAADLTGGPPPSTFVSGTNVSVALRARVAWRTAVMPDGTIVMAHQREVDGPVEQLLRGGMMPDAGAAYGGSGAGPFPGGPDGGFATCVSPVVRSMLTFIPDTGPERPIGLAGVLPVDLAISPDGNEVAVALAGSGIVERIQASSTETRLDLCARVVGIHLDVGGLVSGVAYQPDGTIVVHSAFSGGRLVLFRNGARVSSFALGNSAPPDPGRDFFHTPINGVACASCHPEGRDDGHVWTVASLARRTPSLAAGLLETAPFHWQGEFADLKEVVEDTVVKRMGGDMPPDAMINELANWIDGIPRPAPTAGTTAVDLEQITAGKALFEDAAVGCTRCHAGAALSSKGNFDVGTGGNFQVPSLRGVGSRGPWLHTGTAPTLRERFTIGGSERHGTTTQLSSMQLDELTAYLESL